MELRWKKLDCVACNGTGYRSKLKKEKNHPDRPCLACDGTLAFFLNNLGEIASHPTHAVAGTWVGKFELLDAEGVKDWQNEFVGNQQSRRSNRVLRSQI